MINTQNSTVLVTGGASGIGLALASRFAKDGSRVIICGRRAEKLEEAKRTFPSLETRVCNIAIAEEREALAQWASSKFPEINILINNAGIQRRLRLQDEEPWEKTREEIATNFDAPVHLAKLFIPHFKKQKSSAIINVTSGLAFAPLANVPVYCATKAALRSFTISLRHQLAQTSVEVIELIPPAVNTDLGGPGLHTFGAPLNEFADSVFQRIKAGETEVGFGTSEKSRLASRDELNEIFNRMNPQEASM